MMLHIDKNAFFNVYLFMTNQDKFGIFKTSFFLHDRMQQKYIEKSTVQNS